MPESLRVRQGYGRLRPGILRGPASWRRPRSRLMGLLCHGPRYRGRAVDWFEQGRIRSFRVEVGRGCDPDGPGDGGCHFREQVTEEVGADDDVEGVRASTSLAARASACIKDASTSGKSEDISRKISSKNGIVTLIPFDLVAPIRRSRD